jgi:hypothetical protein
MSSDTTRLVPLPDGPIGGRYDVVRAIGKGGMGAVFEVLDRTHQKKVALKWLLLDTMPEQRRARLRFRREFHTLAGLSHPRIVEVFDFGEHEGNPFYTMELLEGEDLRELGAVPAVTACLLLRDVASALALLHGRGFVHRDLAPRNVRHVGSGRAKLMDFGILATIGVASDIAGTPPTIAPECLRGAPLDARADLYSLGVLLYGALTGKAPFQVRAFNELERAWRKMPDPPSLRAPHPVPRALDDLVLGLLSIDPAGRPTTAAEVIDRLSAAVGLEPDPDLSAPRGYLESASIVGRERELRVLRKAVARAVRGRGAHVHIRAESGTGKSRLLREASMEAKIAGASVAIVRCEPSEHAPYALMLRVAEQITDALPEDAEDAARPFAAQLARVFPALGQRLGIRVLEAEAVDPGEERMRTQRAVLDWILAISDRRPIALFVDDVQRCDEASATVLLSLTRENKTLRLLLVTAQRTGETPRAPVAVEMLGRAKTELALQGLSIEEIEEMLRGLFGDAAHLDRLARQFESRTFGSPMLCAELARSLVETGVVKFLDGLWVLPAELPAAHGPTGLAFAMEEKIARLSDHGRGVAEALAIAAGTFTLELVADLASGLREDELLSALDELLLAGVLLGDARAFWFRHDGLREAVLRGIDEVRARGLHLSAAEALTRAGAPEAAIAWHCYRGGEVERGADMLARVGRALYEAQALADCIPALEASLSVIERRGAPRAVTMELEFMLLAAGWVANREVGRRHAERAVMAYRAHSGVELAHRMGRVVGWKLGLVVGIAVASVKWVFRRGKARGPTPIVGVTFFATALGYACGLANAENRIGDSKELARLAEPLSAFRGRIPEGIYLTIQAFPDILLGALGRAGQRFTRALEIFHSDKLTPAPRRVRLFAEAGLRGLRLLCDVNQFDRRLFEDLAALEAMPFRYYHLVVQATRVVHHRYRGEEKRARKIQRALETASLQLGSWSTDVQILFFAHPAYALCHDILGLKQSIEELERLSLRGFDMRLRLAISRAEYQRERGDPASAVQSLHAALETVAEDDQLMMQWLLSALAEALLAAGDLVRAEEVARRTVKLGEDPISGLVLTRLRCIRILALAECARGDKTAAAQRLDRAILETNGYAIPSLLGQMYEARARVALAAGDRDTFSQSAIEMMDAFRSTENPALLRFGQRAIDAGAPSHMRSVHPETLDTSGLDASTSVTSRDTIVDRKRGDMQSADSASQDDET